MKFLKYFLVIPGLIIVALRVIIGGHVLTNYSPPAKDKILVEQDSDIMMRGDEIFRVMTFGLCEIRASYL